MLSAGKIFLATLLSMLMLTGCGAKSYKDGVYRAEFQRYDSRGYKDFIEVTVENATVTGIVYNAVTESGALKTDDEKYQKDMETVQGTNPSRYSQDLVNQYMETHSISDVDTIAGATYSSDSFVALFKALESSMTSGKTETVLVENLTEK